MDPALQALRRERAVRALVPLFLVSGATSLIYETLWSRQLHLVFGTSQLAVATVLAAFMAGLAAGGLIAARAADRVARPLLVYAGLEAFIGLYALVFPALVRAFEPLYLSFHRATDPGPLAASAFHFALLGLLLLPPTTAMGATLPLLARFATRAAGEAGAQVGRLYGANTLGAVVGTGLAGFVLLPGIGLHATTVGAATANALLAATAGWFGLQAAPLDRAPVAATRARPREAPLWLLAALAGFASLLYEVAWFRVLVLTLGGSAYAFTLMLLAFLIGIGVGGLAGGGAADRAFARGGRARVLVGLAGLQVAVGALAWGTMYAYGELPFAITGIYDAVGEYTGALWAAELALSLAVTLPPTLCMGAAFPFLVRAAVDADGDAAALGGPVGRLYGANTVGAIGGAAIGGFFLLPWLHVTGSVLLAVTVNLAAAALAFALARGRTGGIFAVGAAVVATAVVHVRPPPWDPLLMTSGMYKYAAELSDRSRAGVIEYAIEPYNLRFYDEGLSSVVTVAQAKDTGNIWLANNGKVEASTTVDMPTQLLVAHLPFAFHDDPARVLVIGLASGITAGAVVQHQAPATIDLVELEPAIVAASHIFDDYNNRPLEDPRLKLHLNDGRNHLTLAPEGTYDLVVAEPSNPWLSGVSNLFTREFFELGASRLAPGGVWSQWVQMYGMGNEDLRSLLGTFASVFPHVRLFSTIQDGDLVLVGSFSPLAMDGAAITRRLWADPGVARQLAQLDVHRFEDLLTFYQLDRARILEVAADAGLNTDDNMRIEYSAPLHLYSSTAEENFLSLLYPDGQNPVVPVDAAETFEARVALAEAYAHREDWLRALLVLKAADALQPGDPNVELLYGRWQLELKAELDAVSK